MGPDPAGPARRLCWLGRERDRARHRPRRRRRDDRRDGAFERPAPRPGRTERGGLPRLHDRLHRRLDDRLHRRLHDRHRRDDGRADRPCARHRRGGRRRGLRSARRPRSPARRGAASSRGSGPARGRSFPVCRPARRTHGDPCARADRAGAGPARRRSRCRGALSGSANPSLDGARQHAAADPAPPIERERAQEDEVILARRLAPAGDDLDREARRPRRREQRE